MKLRLSATALALATFTAFGYASAQTTPTNTLVAAKVATAPNLAVGERWRLGCCQAAVHCSFRRRQFRWQGEHHGHAEGGLLGRHAVHADPVRRPDRVAATGPLPEAGRRLVEEALRPGKQGRGRQRLLRGQMGIPVADQQLGEGLREERLRRHVPRRGRQAFRQQVHRERGRDRRHVAHEGRHALVRSATSTTSTRIARATTPRPLPTPAARATRVARSTPISMSSPASPR